MYKTEVIKKNHKGTIILMDDGSCFITVEDIRVNQDYKVAIANIKESEKYVENRAQRLLDCALKQTMMEMRKYKCSICDEDEAEEDILEATQKYFAKKVTELYISKSTMEMIFYNVGYDCLKKYGKKNGEEQIAFYTEVIYAFISFLLKKRPCKGLDSEISAVSIEKIIRPMAIGKLQSKEFPYFLLFCVMLSILPENYILCMFDDAKRAQKRESVIEARNEIEHLYDYEYVLDQNYPVDKVTTLRLDIFDIYQVIVDYFWNFVRVELINQEKRIGYKELEYQQLSKVLYKKRDMEIDGYLYLYESFMEMEHYWAKNNFNHMMVLLKDHVGKLEDLVEAKISCENKISENSEGKQRKRNRTKVDKYRMDSFDRILKYYELAGECFYKTQRNEYIKKSIHIILDDLSKEEISGKLFPALEKKKFLDEQQKKEHTYAMKYADCMLLYLVKCYEEELVPDILERYCAEMTQRYINTYAQKDGCDEIENIVNEIAYYYKIYEQEFELWAGVQIQELFEDNDVVNVVGEGIIKHVWQDLFREFDISQTVKEAFPEEEIGELVTEKAYLSLGKKLKKSRSKLI